ncbi:MAG TPA: hypothetical protein VGD64_05355 [Acidisarcina sp.]
MKLELKKWPFGAIVALSIILSVFHALVQLRWAALRYRSFGPRPLGAQAVIAVEVLLLMVIFTVGMMHVSDEESTSSSGRYYLGIVTAVGAWIVVSFFI